MFRRRLYQIPTPPHAQSAQNTTQFPIPHLDQAHERNHPRGALLPKRADRATRPKSELKTTLSSRPNPPNPAYQPERRLHNKQQEPQQERTQTRGIKNLQEPSSSVDGWMDGLPEHAGAPRPRRRSGGGQPRWSGAEEEEGESPPTGAGTGRDGRFWGVRTWSSHFTLILIIARRRRGLLKK